MAVGNSDGARTTSVAATVGKLMSGKKEDTPTPKRPRLREGAAKDIAAAASPSRRGEDSKTPTRELRRRAAQDPHMQTGNPARNSPRSEHPRVPDSPPVKSAPRGKKRGAVEEEPGEAKRQRKKARIESGGAATATPSKAESTSGEIKFFRSLTGSGLKGLMRKEKTPSREDLHRDPDENYERREAQLPSAGSFLFSRGAVPTTLLDSTTEETPQRPHTAKAPDSETEKG